MNREIHLRTPLADEALEQLRAGDIVYLDGDLVTCRDVAHRRLVEEHLPLPVDLKRKAIFHAGPIVRELDNGRFEMISVGPTTSMRMERFEKEFIRQTQVKMVIGKGGMAAETEEACRLYKAVHAVFPGGCAVVAAECVEAIEDAQWRDLGMPETLWVCRVRNFGPLIISIDTQGNNLFRTNRAIYAQRAKQETEAILPYVSYIK